MLIALDVFILLIYFYSHYHFVNLFEFYVFIIKFKVVLWFMFCDCVTKRICILFPAKNNVVSGFFDVMILYFICLTNIGSCMYVQVQPLLPIFICCCFVCNYVIMFVGISMEFLFCVVNGSDKYRVDKQQYKSSGKFKYFGTNLMRCTVQ